MPRRQGTQKKGKKGFGFFHYVWWGVKYLFKGLWWLLLHLWKGIRWLVSRPPQIVRVNATRTPKQPCVSELKVLATVKGDFSRFWEQFCSSDSTIGIVLGARGSGKTAFALMLMEDLKGQKEHVYAMGFPSKKLPRWVSIIERTEHITNDSFVVVDEGGILFSSRESMSSANKMLSELLLIARHKNLTIVFISQNSSNIEVNTLRQADFLALKKSSLLQSEFERKIIAKIYGDYAQKFEQYGDRKGVTLLYSHDFIGFIENGLPSFWSSDVGKSFK